MATLDDDIQKVMMMMMVLERERERDASKTRRKEEEMRTAGCTGLSDGTKGRTVP